MNYALKSALSHFEHNNGELIIGGKTISSIAQIFGTPVYIYDTSVIKWRYSTLKNTLPEQLKIYYAVKANPNLEILKIIGNYYDGFDVASQGEMKKVLKAGFSPEMISFTGPGKSIDELNFAIKHNIGSISVESEREGEHIYSICNNLNKTARILIRVNPDFELNQSGMKMGGRSIQFGIDSNRVPALIDKIRPDNLIKFEGIHIFAGSQNLESDQLVQTFDKILEYAGNLSTSSNVPIKTINMGGGFGIPYYSHEKDLDINAVGKGLKVMFKKYLTKFPNTTLKIELGRFIIGECGIYLSRILYRKISNNKVFLVTNGGMHHNLAASGNLGQSLVRRPMPITIANRLNDPIEKATVVGKLCTPIDTFGTVKFPKADEGDLIAIFNSGAYGYSASPIGFLSHEPPKEMVM